MASTSTSTSYTIPEKYGNFKRSAGPVNLQESYNQPINVTKWTSDKTGLRVVHVDVEGPLCNLYASVATEIFNDSGCPHTLEHLVFLGSEKYPFKGVLDSLANRAFASGTNAWTDTTNTTYTVTTAGEEGFLRILPIYMDHVLYPTITDAGFTTEVYHINGKAEDGGVVYSEMQGRENASFSVMGLAQQRALYPDGSAYRSETGGLMSALRVLTADQIRQYHGSYYLPHNLCLFATGKIDPTKLLRVLSEQVEPSIEAHQQARGPKPSGWKRPFMDTPSRAPPALSGDRMETVEFPEKDESMGEVCISWVGVENTDYLTDKAIDILNAYLSDSAISPLQKELVEVDDPLATEIGFDTLDQTTTIINLNMSSVPTEKLDGAAEQAKDVLRKVLNEGIDLDRMTMVLHREQRKLLNTLEKDAADALTYSLLSDFLFGAEDSSDLPKSLDDIKRFKELLSWDAKKWGNLLEKYYLDASSLTIIGKPSASLADRLEAETKAREEKRQTELGEAGLKKLADKIEQAQKENDRDIPPEMLKDFKIPDVAGIRWIDVASAGAGTNKGSFGDNDVQKHLEKDTTDLPYFIQFEHVQSNFIEVSIFLEAANLPAKRELLNLYMNTFHSLPIERDGRTLPFEEVVKLLDTETVDYDISFGSGLSEQIEVSIRVEKDKYTTAISWLRDLLFGSQFDESRLKIVAKKLAQNLPSEKREGLSVATGVFRELTQDAGASAGLAMGLIARLKSSPAIVERLKAEPQAVVKDMEELRQALTSPKGMRIAVSGDILALTDAKAAWAKHFHAVKPAKLSPVVFGKDCLSALGKNPANKATVVPLPSIESSFSYHVAKGPNTYDHPDLPALMVARTVLNALEGLLWKSIRGAGLAYGANIVSDVERGFTYFRVYRSPDCSKAYVAARKAMQSMLDGSYMPLDDLMIEAAKSELAFFTANAQSTLSSAAENAFVNEVLRGVPQSYQRDLLEKAGRVSKDEVAAAVEKWLMPIFDPKTSIAAVATAKSKSEDVQKQLREINFDVTVLDIVGEGEQDGDGDGESGSESGDSDESWSEVEKDSQPETK